VNQLYRVTPVKGSISEGSVVYTVLTGTRLSVFVQGFSNPNKCFHTHGFLSPHSFEELVLNLSYVASVHTVDVCFLT
jgi:hypothetical protein